MAIVLALVASLSWGVSDFLGGLGSRRFGVGRVVLVSAPAGLVVVTLVVAVRGVAFPHSWTLLWGVVAGVTGATGIAAFYRALAVGRMGVVAPITAASPLIPVVLGLARGERPGPVQYVGMAVALVGVVLTAREAETDAAHGRIAAGVGLALVATVAFGTTQAALDEVSNVDPYWGTFVLRATFVVATLAALAFIRPGLPPRRAVPPLALIGALDVTATLLFAVASSRGLLSVVAVLSSLYPVVVVVLARVVLSERLQRVQLVGAGIALTGAAMVSAG
jgi:drug/metabolite transporter (DMT)-like permease